MTEEQEKKTAWNKLQKKKIKIKCELWKNKEKQKQKYIFSVFNFFKTKQQKKRNVSTAKKEEPAHVLY